MGPQEKSRLQNPNYTESQSIMQYEEDEDGDEEGDEDGEYGNEEMDPYDSRL